MKFSSKLAILGAVAGLSTASVVIADEAAPTGDTATESPVVEDPAVDLPDSETPPADDNVTDPETPGDDEAVPDEVVAYEDGEVPIDWVKRGGELENPDVIFYNMAGGGAPTPASSSQVSDEASKGEATTASEAKTVAPAAQITRVKKGPVALVKGARVFLRH